ncbi:MAG: DUF58 domain-containing protein [Clostridiaceae bacterium]|jgi:hypothetical protein|nr:DUF58 domain-containing protein [Clostridiaceae bacterium]
MDVIALLMILLAVLWLQAYILGNYAFSKLDYSCKFSVPEAHEGDTIYLVETVYNGKLLPVPWLKVDIHTSRWLDFAGTCSVIAQDSRRVTSSFLLKSYQKTTRRWKLNCVKRGIFHTENVTLIGGDLLNLCNISEALPVNMTLVVYPEIVDLDELFMPVNLLQSDNTVNRWIIDDPFMFSGIREHTPTDPMNRIHWPATAKTGKLMTRKNEYTSQQNLTVILNMQTKSYEHTDVIHRRAAELGIKVAATLFDRALREGTPVLFATNGCIHADDKLPIITREAADKDHITGLFKILAGLLMKSVRSFEGLLEDVSPNLENSETVIITAYLDREICAQADHMAQGGNRVCVILVDTEYESGALPVSAELYILSDRSWLQSEEWV